MLCPLAMPIADGGRICTLKEIRKVDVTNGDLPGLAMGKGFPEWVCPTV